MNTYYYTLKSCIDKNEPTKFKDFDFKVYEYIGDAADGNLSLKILVDENLFSNQFTKGRNVTIRNSDQIIEVTSVYTKLKNLAKILNTSPKHILKRFLEPKHILKRFLEGEYPTLKEFKYMNEIQKNFRLY